MGALFSLGEGDEGKVREELRGLMGEAREKFRHRNVREAVGALHRAHGVATRAGLHREAAQIQRALGILASGGRPKLLVREGELGER